MNKLKIFVFSIILLSVISINSQVVKEWVRRYGDEVSTEAVNPFMGLDATGNIYIAGTIDSEPGSGQDFDFIVIKYSPAGVQQWVQTYGGAAHLNDELKDMKTGPFGNVYITGTVFSDTGYQSIDICTIKYNSSGTRQWVYTYDSPSHLNETAAALDVDNSGNVCVVGTIFSQPMTVPLLKLNQNGGLIWSKIIGLGAPVSFGAIDINVDNAGNIITALGYCPFEVTYYSVYKLNQNGDSLWWTGVGSQWHGGGVNHLKCDIDGNIYVSGNNTPYFWNNFFGYVRKISPSGSIIWSYSYPENSYQKSINNFCIDDSGNVYTAGKLSQSGSMCLTSKINSDSLIWSRYYSNGSSSENSGSAVTSDKYGDIYVTGSSYGTNTNYDYATVKYNSEGDSIWVVRYNHTANDADQPSAVEVDSAGNVYVTGISRNSNGTFSFATVKYNQINGVKNINTDVPNSYNLSQNYPNPFNPVTKIKFQIAKSGSVKLIVFDVSGREVIKLINEKLNPGTYEAEWDGTNYPSGVYFYKLITNDYSETKKMVLIK